MTPASTASDLPPVDLAAARAATVAYALIAATPLFWPAPLIAIIVVEVARESARGTWVASHLRWLRRTFWFTLLWILVGSATAVFLVGFVILGVATIWFVYRIARGWLLLVGERPIHA